MRLAGLPTIHCCSLCWKQFRETWIGGPGASCPRNCIASRAQKAQCRITWRSSRRSKIEIPVPPLRRCGPTFSACRRSTSEGDENGGMSGETSPIHYAACGKRPLKLLSDLAPCEGGDNCL